MEARTRREDVSPLDEDRVLKGKAYMARLKSRLVITKSLLVSH